MQKQPLSFFAHGFHRRIRRLIQQGLTSIEDKRSTRTIKKETGRDGKGVKRVSIWNRPRPRARTTPTTLAAAQGKFGISATKLSTRSFCVFQTAARCILIQPSATREVHAVTAAGALSFGPSSRFSSRRDRFYPATVNDAITRTSSITRTIERGRDSGDGCQRARLGAAAAEPTTLPIRQNPAPDSGCNGARLRHLQGRLSFARHLQCGPQRPSG